MGWRVRCFDRARRCADGWLQAMLTKWTGMLAEAGLRGKHVSFEPAGASQVREWLCWGRWVMLTARFCGPPTG